MVAVSISPKNVDECVKGSFDGSDMNKDDNSILREERQRFVKRGIQNWPTLMINNATYRVYIYYLFNSLLIIGIFKSTNSSI